MTTRDLVVVPSRAFRRRPPRLRTPSQTQDLMGGWGRIPISAICSGAPEPRDLGGISRSAISVDLRPAIRPNSSSQIGEIPPRSRFEIRRSSSQVGEIPRRSVVEREHARARDDALRPVACERVAVGKVEHPLALMNEAIRAPQESNPEGTPEVNQEGNRVPTKHISTRARTSLRPEAHSPS